MTNAQFPPLEIGEVRRQVRLKIEALKHESLAHRAEASSASANFEPWLEGVAVPLFKQFVNALRAEGLQFRVLTPARRVRVEAERSQDDFLELSLDTERRPVAVVLRRSYTRGHHVFTDERVVSRGSDVTSVTAAQLLEKLVDDAAPFLGR